MVSPARHVRVLRTAAMLSFVAACASPAPRSADSSAASRAGRVDDTTRIAQLEREARALVRTSGCDAVSSCRTAPVGWRACGGPRAYVVYCAASTDTAALLRKLEELRRVEADYLERAGMASTCEMRMPPNVVLEGGSCAASP